MAECTCAEGRLRRLLRAQAGIMLRERRGEGGVLLRCPRRAARRQGTYVRSLRKPAALICTIQSVYILYA